MSHRYIELTKSVMARKCPPGVICVQNAMFVSMFAILALLLAFVVYRSTSQQQIVRAQTQTGPNIMNAAMQQQQQSQPSSWFDGFSLQGLFPRPSYSFSNVENDVLMNPYAAPLRDDRNVMMGGRDIRGGIPINVSTQGTPDSQYRQIGILTRQNGGEMILPLMGRPLMANRDKWQFYTINNNNIKLPIVNRGKSCTNEYGCDNLYNGDSVYVEGIKDAFNVTVYDNAVARYIPF